MSSFLKSLELSSPLLLLIALGYFLKRIKMVNEEVSVDLSKIVLNVLLPVNLFLNIYDSNFKEAFNVKLMTFIVVSNIIFTILSIFYARIFTKDSKSLSAMLQVCVRGNHSIFGVPLAISIYGNIVGAPMSIASGLLSGIYCIYAIGLFEYFQNTNKSKLEVLLNVLKAPLTLSVILGVLFNVLHIHIPEFGYNTLNYMSKSLTAISLINIGLSFNFTIDTKCIKLLIPAVLYKILVMPAIATTVAALMGFRNADLVTIFAITSVPVALACFPTANCYDTDLELTKAATVYSHVGCAIAIPLMLSLIQVFGLI